MTRRYGIWVLLLMLAVAGGCSSSGSSASSEGPRYVMSKDTLISPSAIHDLGYSARWVSELNLGKKRTLRAAEILGDTLVTVASPGNIVAATSMRTGERLWTVSVTDETEKLFAPIRFEDSVYVNSETTMYELDVHTGEHRSAEILSEPVTSGPVLIDDRAIFGSINGTVYAHSLVTGRYRWKYRLTARITTPPIAVGLSVFAADAKGTYVMLAASDGAMQWQGRVFDAVTVAPAIDRVSIYVASRDSFLYSIDRSTGADKWKYAAATPLIYPAKAIGLGVFVPVPGQGLVALDSVDGGVRWTHAQPAYPITVNGDNLVAATQNSISLIETDTGRVVQTVPTSALDDVITGPDDSLLLFSPKGKIVRIDPL